MTELTKPTAFLENEAELVVRAQTEESAWVELYEFYFPKIYSFVAKRVGHREATEDIVSEVFLRATAQMTGFHGDVKFGGWLFRVAANLVIDRARSQQKVRNVEEGEAEAMPSRDARPDEIAQLLLDRTVLEKILAGLPPRDREILHLKFFAELDNSEIAAAIDVTPNNVGVLVHRALARASKLAEKYVC